MVGRVERRVPERHEAVADVLVDGAAFRQHRGGERRVQRIEEAHDAFGVQQFRARGEVAHVAEEDGRLARFTTQPQARGIGRDALDDGRRHVALERAAHVLALVLRPQVRRKRARDVGGDPRDAGHQRVEQEIGPREQQP